MKFGQERLLLLFPYKKKPKKKKLKKYTYLLFV